MTTSPNLSEEAHLPHSGAIANGTVVASSPTEQVSKTRTTMAQCSSFTDGSLVIGREILGKHTEDHPRSENRDESQSQSSIRMPGDALHQQPHCTSRFELAAPGGPQIDADLSEPENDRSSQGNGVENSGFGIIDVADIGLNLPEVLPKASGNIEYPRPLTGEDNAGDQVLIELAVGTPVSQDLTAAASSRNPESVARQAWEVTEQHKSQRGQANPENASRPPRSSTSPRTELCPTSTEESAQAENANTGHSPIGRSRGPSALRSLSFDQPQRDNRKTLQDFDRKFSKTARKSCLSPAPATNRTRDEDSSIWRPANRSAGGSDPGARSPSAREVQKLESACLSCRSKQTKCDRRWPRCK